MLIPLPPTNFPDTHGRAVNVTTYSPDGTWLVGAGGFINQPGDILVWDAKTLELRNTMSAQEPTVHKLAFSHDCLTLASSSYGNGGVELWDTTHWHRRVTLQPPRHTWIADMVFTQDGKTLVAGCWDMTAKIWDLEIGAFYELPSERNAHVDMVAFLKNDAILLTGMRSRIRAWMCSRGICYILCDCPMTN